eukprot:COSAG01_NODE_3423_length_6115_cov_3.557347_1_plen_74_part_10
MKYSPILPFSTPVCVISAESHGDTTGFISSLLVRVTFRILDVFVDQLLRRLPAVTGTPPHAHPKAEPPLLMPAD